MDLGAILDQVLEGLEHGQRSSGEQSWYTGNACGETGTRIFGVSESSQDVSTRRHFRLPRNAVSAINVSAEDCMIAQESSIIINCSKDIVMSFFSKFLDQEIQGRLDGMADSSAVVPISYSSTSSFLMAA
jgi:hypothetical protein